MDFSLSEKVLKGSLRILALGRIQNLHFRRRDSRAGLGIVWDLRQDGSTIPTGPLFGRHKNGPGRVYYLGDLLFWRGYIKWGRDLLGSLVERPPHRSERNVSILLFIYYSG